MGMVVIQTYILVSKLKKIKTKLLCCTGYLNSVKKNYKARFLILILVQQQNFLNCKPRVLQLLKKHVIKYCERVYERSCRNLCWSIKKSGKILDKL